MDEEQIPGDSEPQKEGYNESEKVDEPESNLQDNEPNENNAREAEEENANEAEAAVALETVKSQSKQKKKVETGDDKPARKAKKRKKEDVGGDDDQEVQKTKKKKHVVDDDETQPADKPKKKKAGKKIKTGESVEAEPSKGDLTAQKKQKKKPKEKKSKTRIGEDAGAKKKLKDTGEDAEVKKKQKAKKTKNVKKDKGDGDKPSTTEIATKASKTKQKKTKVEKKASVVFKKISSSRGSLRTPSTRFSSAKFARSSSKNLDSLSHRSSQWSFVEDDVSIDSDYSYEDIPTSQELKSSSLYQSRSKIKKGKKKEKGKKVKTVSSDTGTVVSIKTKKKGGKKKKGGIQVAEETIEPQEDVLAEIARMKYLAELEARGHESEEETTEAGSKTKKPKKEKTAPKKKLSKKEKAKLAAEQAEKARQSAEEEAKKAAELERIRLEEERKAAIEKEKREAFEQQIRAEQLEAATLHFQQVMDYVKNLRTQAKDQAEWEFYVNCGRLPNPSKCDQMNTFLHLWENVVDATTMEEAAARTVDMLELLDDLDDLIDTAENKSDDLVENWKWVRLLFRKQQAKSLDVATYRLLRNIEKNMHRIDIPTADYKYQDDNIALGLWLRIQLPTPLPNPRRPPKPRIEVNFPQTKLEVQFPLSVDGDKTAVRALYVKYDHLSDLSNTYQKPEVPKQYDLNLYEAMTSEWRKKMLYKYENRVRKTPPLVTEESDDNPTDTPQEDIIGPEDEIPVVPYRKLEPTASEYVISNEDTLYEYTRMQLVKTVSDDVINMRKFTIIGGVYSLNLLKQPPQPQDFVTLEMNLTPLYLPKELEVVGVNLQYTTPAPPPAGVRRLPEEIEEEMKRQEEEMDKLILVTLTWPDHVIFLELPIVCFWDETRLLWTKSEVLDLKHNEEKVQLTFRTKKGGTFALAAYRCANLPYQAWEMRPEANGSITLQITAAILLVEFNVQNGLIALSQLQNSPNNALQDIIGIYYPLPKLIRMLQNAGVDVFPAFDAFCYIENTCEKHWPMEKHLYFNMAEMGLCFNFAWSRWNIGAGRRSIVLQMREYNVEKTKQKNHMMLHVTPLSAIFVDCTEVSQTFTEEGVDNMKFYPDLFHLMKGTSSMVVKKKVAKASQELIFAVYELLIATRVVSFS